MFYILQHSVFAKLFFKLEVALFLTCVLYFYICGVNWCIFSLNLVSPYITRPSYIFFLAPPLPPGETFLLLQLDWSNSTFCVFLSSVWALFWWSIYINTRGAHQDPGEYTRKFSGRRICGQWSPWLWISVLFVAHKHPEKFLNLLFSFHIFSISKTHYCFSSSKMHVTLGASLADWIWVWSNLRLNGRRC
jgi:hypothetical protein